MRSALIALSLSFFAAGCSEYDLTGDNGPNGDGDDTDGGVDTDQVHTESCDDDAFPGYPTGHDDDCANDIETGTFTPVIEWEMGTFNQNSQYNQVMSQPVVADVNTNGTPDIVVMMFSMSGGAGGAVRALKGDGSGELWSHADSSFQGQGGVAVADIDSSSPGLETVVAAIGGVITLDSRGNEMWRNTNLGGSVYNTSDNPAIADMDGDGVAEIIIGSAILDNHGALVGQGQYGRGGVIGNVGTASFAADIDGNGVQEVITGNAAYRKNGTAIWHTNTDDGYPAVADFDFDGDAEIVLGGGGMLRMIDTDGTPMWGQSIPGAGSSYYGGAPTIADFDGDGEPEIGIASGSRYSVFEGNGTLLWQAVTDDSSSGNTGSAVFDFEGDGAAEVVYADQTTLWVFDGATGGIKLQSNHHSNGTWLEYPTIADVDGDGHAEIVVVHDQQYGTLTGITVFGDADNSWRPGRTIWNQYAYSITNVDDDGTVPASPDLNWDSFNNFRSGDTLSGNGLSTVDLTVAQADYCSTECDRDRLTVYVNAGNEGAVDLGADAVGVVDMYVVVDGVETLFATKRTGAIPMGQYNDALQFEITDMDVTTIDSLVFRIHSGELDCDSSNDELVWNGPFCD